MKAYRIDGFTIGSVRNAVLRDYARTYVEIAADVVRQIEAMGVRVAPEASRGPEGRADELSALGVRVENDCRSLGCGWLSPACATCRRGVGSTTFYLSLACNRDCFFCFNPNQRGYADYHSAKHDLIGELDKRFAAGVELCDIALTGGEPLLFTDEALGFFKRASELYPDAYMRLYTNGDFVDRRILENLRDAGLNEIRISVKQNEAGLPYSADPAVEKIRLSAEVLDHAVVEMPVLPGDVERMKGLLLALDEAGASGINLLELCYPGHNWPEYERRGYSVKRNVYRVPYGYEYAGGLPIAGSEEAALDLLEFAAGAGLTLGVHYCSLENKFTSQVYLQNAPYADSGAMPMAGSSGSLGSYALSTRDCFFKCAKAFGEDALAAINVLGGKLEGGGSAPALTFHPSRIAELAESHPDMELGLCYAVAEPAGEGVALHELAIDCVRAADFCPERDL